MSGFGPTFGWPQADVIAKWMQEHPQQRLRALVRAFADHVFKEPEAKDKWHNYDAPRKAIFPPSNWH